MSQINLDTSPYFDDFDPAKDYYRVLFKPGFPVQARELTTLQSILQNQISTFGEHFFKEGSMVIPGGITYNPNYSAVILNPQQGGIDVSLYLEQLIGVEIVGETSGVKAKVVNYVLPPNEGVTNPTIFVVYSNSGNDNVQSEFLPNEALTNLQPVVYGNTTITANSIFGTTVSVDATATGSAARIENGVYFVRGTFVQVAASTVILQPYINIASYRVGLQIVEQTITAGQDPSLYDNAKGFNNFSAPGADRLRITATLIKKPIPDTNDTNFVELLRVENGEIKKLAENSDYNVIKDYIAQRTYEESGDYVVRGLGVTLDESLNDGIGNAGIYTIDQKTQDGSQPSDDLAIIKVQSGKAYVRGYDIANPGTQNLDAPKPRETGNVANTSIPFEMGSQFLVNNVYGTPALGLDIDDNIVELYDGRKDELQNPTGTLIGEARVYSFALEDAPASNLSVPWALYMFDTQIFTKLTLNVDASAKILAAYKIQGLSSGATGFARTINGSDVVLTQVSGEFAPGEAVSVNGVTSEPFSITSLESYKAVDVKSVSQSSTAIVGGLQVDFSADTVLYSRTPSNFVAADSFTIGAQVGGASTVTCPGRVFNDFKPGDVIVYQQEGETLLTYNKVDSISADQLSMSVVGIASVASVNLGGLPGDVVRSPMRILESSIRNQENSFLYAIMEERNIAKTDLANSDLIFSAQVTNLTTSAQGALTINTSALNVDNSNFVAFDQERYSIHYADGSVQQIEASNVVVSGPQVNFTGLRPNQNNNVTANVTAVKTGIRSKTKIVLRSEEIVIDKISTGIGTGDYGLTKNRYYGLRVDDEEISLNVPDVKEVIKVYESLDSGNPTLDTLLFVQGLSLNTNTIKGEIIRGQSSGAIARLVKSTAETTCKIVYLSQTQFEVGELVTFSESSIQTNLQGIEAGNYADITSSFTLDKGQREQFYDYSRLVRRKNAKAPNKRLLVIVDRFVVPQNDKGDVYTASSYDTDSFNKGMPMLGDNGSIRASDTLDFRPRVRPFTLTSSSPFDYTSRDFGTSGNTTPLVVTPNEGLVLGYDFYLGRRDRVILNKLGDFKLVQGASAKEPQLPAEAEGAMELARITYPPYLYNVDDAQIEIIDNKRYTMKDIGLLEDRIEDLEEITSLSLLERETESLQVIDADGNDRFKSGFFADDFTSSSFVDFEYEDTQIDVNTNAGALVCFNEFATIPLRLQIQDGLDEEALTLNGDIPLVDSNTTKTGDLVTLNYSEVEWIKQPLCSRVENVNPFNVILYDGSVTLNPRSDDFVITREIGSRRIDVFGESTGSFNRTFVESIEVAQFMRERNVGFAADGLRPHTRFFIFFEGSSGVDFIPKLIQINMRSGTFQPGETVRGFNGNSQIFGARVCSPNHKTGNITAPDRTFRTNPYERETTVPTTYSSSSTVLNIDTDSLADITDGRFFGLIGQGVRLVGSSSGAVADVTEIQLVSDSFGELFGCVYFRDPYTTPAPAFRLRTGIRTFKLSSSATDEEPILGSTSVSFADTVFESGGTVANRRTETVTIRDLPPPPPPIIIDQTVTNNFTEVIDQTVTNNFTEVIDRTVTVNNNITNVQREVVERVEIRERPVDWQDDDPLSQTFRVDETGAFLTSVDLFFATKPSTDENLTVQIRPTDLATPVNFLLQDYAEVILSPEQIEVSDDGSVPTRVVFPSPIYLEPEITYALVILAPTTNDYTAWIARMGEENISGEAEEAGGTAIIAQQYLNGSLFKSQNGSIWTASQFEDLKFTLYKASFTNQSGTVFLTNPSLNNATSLSNNPITTLPRKLRVPVNSTTYPFEPGDGLTSVGAGSTDTVKVRADLEAIGGPMSTLVITDGGVGFVDGTYNGVELYPVDSSGLSAEADITVSGNTITSLSITNGGTGYKVGDTVGVTTADVGLAGGDSFLTVEAIGDTDTLYVTNARGQSMVASDTIKLYNPSTGDLEYTGVQVSATSAVLNPMNEGNVFVIDFPVHGMHSDQNEFTLNGVLPDTVGTVVTQNVNITSNSLSVADNSAFGTFEGISTSVGYALLGGEIIEYTDNGDGTLGITSRGVDGTAVSIHDQGTRIFKYELSGISLRRINTFHELPIDSSLGNTRDINSLPVVVDRGGRTSGKDQLNFNQEQQAGGPSAIASQNYQFNRILPSLALLTPGSTTSITSTLRTVSGTSAGGNEVSFLDQGFTPVTINEFNRFDTPRMICSNLNEQTNITGIPRNKSLTLALSFQSSDSNLSPVIDMQQANVVLSRNALNNPVSNYADDSRVNKIVGDPHSSIYCSQIVNLDNPATSLKILISAYRDPSADFRVLYRLFVPNAKNSTPPNWELFPGYTNMIDTTGDGFGNQIVDPSKNNGLPNKFVRASAVNEVLEYQYEVDNLQEFAGFQIKVVFSGTNEARAPFFRDVRAIALA